MPRSMRTTASCFVALVMLVIAAPVLLVSAFSGQSFFARTYDMSVACTVVDGWQTQAYGGSDERSIHADLDCAGQRVRYSVRSIHASSPRFVSVVASVAPGSTIYCARTRMAGYENVRYLFDPLYTRHHYSGCRLPRRVAAHTSGPRTRGALALPGGL